MNGPLLIKLKKKRLNEVHSKLFQTSLHIKENNEVTIILPLLFNKREILIAVLRNSCQSIRVLRYIKET